MGVKIVVMVKLDRTGDVFVIDMGSMQNSCSPDWVVAMGSALDEVEAAPGPKALVTMGTGKHYCNGLDLDVLNSDPDTAKDYLASVWDLLARVLVFPAPTTAAVQGHAFGAGAFLVLAHDRRIMRTDRGYWCLPEAALGMPFTKGLMAIAESTLAPRPLHLAMTTAHRFTGPEALSFGIVDELAPADTIIDRAVEMAGGDSGLNGMHMASIKTHLHAGPFAALSGFGNGEG